MASNPMQQFSVHKIGPEIKIAGIDLSFTNASLFMVISASIILQLLGAVIPFFQKLQREGEEGKKGIHSLGD